MRYRSNVHVTLAVGLWMLGHAASALRADVTLVEDGRAKAAIFVPPAVMAVDDPAVNLHALKNPAKEAEVQRRRLRESVNDLAHYLKLISGAEVAVNPPGDAAAAGAGQVRILVGDLATQAFGPPAKPYPFKQGFRLTVKDNAVGLGGQSDLATSYAIYELLDRLGCRWYMPSDMGEVIPQTKTITLKDTDESLTPGTVYRTIWYADEAYKRRNRMGGLTLHAGHALEITGVYLTAEDKQAHPEWVADIDGKKVPTRIKWSNEAVAHHVADRILAIHEANPQPSYSLSPDDGANWDNSPEDRALDAGDIDTTFGRVSVTDRYLVLCNRIAQRVAAKNPEVLLGFLAYVDYTRPPVREGVHPNLVPQVAPISYSRAHPMNMDEVPGNKELRYIVEGWAAKAEQTSWYMYAFYLAETSAPNPMIRKWGHDVPYVLERGKCRFWQPETIPNFETSLHALYLGNRLAWDPSLKPAEIVDELHRLFYGAAAEPIAAYWDFVDRCWVETPEYAGAAFGYLRRWTPEKLAEARRLMDVAKAAAQTPQERFRVTMADESLGQFELFMKLRRDLAEGRFATLAADAARWREAARALGERYAPQSAFGQMHWTKPGTVHGIYFDAFVGATYTDAARLAAEAQVLTERPLREWRFQADPEKQGEAAGWSKADFDDRGWKTTDVAVDTWSALGFHDYMGSMWYRTTVELPAAAAGKKTYLWLAATDGTAKVFVNGQAIPYQHETLDAAGKKTGQVETKVAADGFCQPFSFDISGAIKDGDNQITVLCTRTTLNELGTGGLMGPVVVYRDK